MKTNNWHIKVSIRAEKQLRKLDHQTQKRINSFLKKKMAIHPNPKDLGKPLTGVLNGLWSFRVGDYRLVCDIQNDIMIIYALDIGHRREIYKMASIH